MDDNPLSYFSLMFLKRSLVAELGDAIDPFVLKLKRVMRQGRPVLLVVLERKNAAEEYLRVISKHLALRVNDAAKPLTGDEVFDSRFALVDTNELECAIFLGAGARNSLVKLYDEAVELDVAPARASVLYGRQMIVKSGKLAGCIGETIGIMDELAAGMGDDVSNRKKIIRNLKGESCPDARPRMLKALLSFYSIDDDITGLLKVLVKDENPMVRAEAAAKLGDEGRTILVKMLENAPAGEIDLTMLLIDRIVDTEAAVPRPLLKKMIARVRDTKLRGSVENFIVSQGDHHPPSLFEDFFERSQIHGVRHALFRAIVTGVKRSNRGWDDFFLKCIEDDDQEIRLESMKALGDTGGIGSVEALLKIIDVLIEGPLREEARQAVKKIQSRQEGVEGGWLSIEKPSEKDGALSVPDGSCEGALSTEEENGEKG